ncbi:MAG: Hsp20/alpha crystallin family protein [Victivallales bacterium]
MINKFLPRHQRRDNYPSTDKGYYNPFLDLQKQMNDLFGTFFDDSSSLLAAPDKCGAFTPKFEISETDKGIDVSAEMPGMEEKDIDISIENNILSIAGEKRFEEEKKEKNYHLTERSYGSFKRSFSLPDGIAVDKVGAKFNNGVLTMHLPKTEEAKKKVTKVKIGK